jgi:hypothetical protein
VSWCFVCPRKKELRAVKDSASKSRKTSSARLINTKRSATKEGCKKESRSVHGGLRPEPWYIHRSIDRGPRRPTWTAQINAQYSYVRSKDQSAISSKFKSFRPQEEPADIHPLWRTMASSSTRRRPLHCSHKTLVWANPKSSESIFNKKKFVEEHEASSYAATSLFNKKDSSPITFHYGFWWFASVVQGRPSKQIGVIGWSSQVQCVNCWISMYNPME